MHASTICNGDRYTVNLTYRPLPSGPTPNKGEEFVVSVIVTDTSGAFLDSFAGGVLFV